MKRVLLMLCLLVACVTVSYFILNPKISQQLHEPDVITEHRIGDFKFQNQNKKIITQEEINGKVFVAEYFFTTCQSICPLMNKQMMRIQENFKGNPNFKILSFTVDPDVDSVEQLFHYAKTMNAINGQWHFLTGEKTDLYRLARKSFFLLKPAEAKNLGDAGSDFIHTNNFVLVDQKKRICAYYDGTSEEEVTKLMGHISLLLNE